MAHFDSEYSRLLVYATSNRRHLLPQMMKDNISIYNGQTDEVNPMKPLMRQYLYPTALGYGYHFSQ